MIKEQEREIKQKLKVVNKQYKELEKKTLKVNKAIKTFEYQIDLRIYKIYEDKEGKKVLRNWQFETDTADNKYVILRKLTNYKMKPSDLSFLKYTLGYFYNIHDDYDIVNAFKRAFDDSFYDLNDLTDYILYFDGFIIGNIAKIEVTKYKEPKFKDIKYKNDAEKGIYSPRPNCCLLTCIINKFYDRFNDLDDKGYRRFKNSLTYSHLCKLLNIEEKEDNIGTSINDVMPFFEKYKLGFVVYNQFMKGIHSYSINQINNHINIKYLK